MTELKVIIWGLRDVLATFLVRVMNFLSFFSLNGCSSDYEWLLHLMHSLKQLKVVIIRSEYYKTNHFWILGLGCRNRLRQLHLIKRGDQVDEQLFIQRYCGRRILSINVYWSEWKKRQSLTTPNLGNLLTGPRTFSQAMIASLSSHSLTFKCINSFMTHVPRITFRKFCQQGQKHQQTRQETNRTRSLQGGPQSAYRGRKNFRICCRQRKNDRTGSHHLHPAQHRSHLP